MTLPFFALRFWRVYSLLIATRSQSAIQSAKHMRVGISRAKNSVFFVSLDRRLMGQFVAGTVISMVLNR